MPNGQICMECGDDFQESNHIRNVAKCAKCKYQSACSRAILEHISNCNGESNVDAMVPCPLGSEMFCICGYSSSEGKSFGIEKYGFIMYFKIHLFFKLCLFK